MTDAYSDAHLPLNETDVAALFDRYGYATMTPARFRDLVAEVVAKVVAAHTSQMVSLGPVVEVVSEGPLTVYRQRGAVGARSTKFTLEQRARMDARDAEADPF